MPICRKCERSFEPRRGGAGRRQCFRCSPYRSHKRKYFAPTARHCFYCRKIFASWNPKVEKFCSTECKRRYLCSYRHQYYMRRRPAPQRKQCLGCGEDFTVVGKRTKFCSPKCLKEDAKKRQVERWAKQREIFQQITRTCPCCGHKFHPRHFNQIYCLRRCASAFGRRAYLKRDKLRIRRNEAKKRRERARKVKIAFETLRQLGIHL
jgi:hypothetical protein